MRSDRRVLITGGAGFIGSHVVEGAVTAGWTVGVLDDLSTGKRAHVPADVPLFHVDVCRKPDVEAAFLEFRPAAVVHLAAQASVAVSTRDPDRDAQVNILGGLHVLQAAITMGVKRFIFASTGGAMYGDIPPGARATRDWIPDPRSPYALSKLTFEKYLDYARRDHGIVPTILRPSNVYGPRQDPSGEAGVIAIFQERLRRGEPLIIFGREREGDDGCIRDYVYVGDVVRVIVAALMGQVDERVVHVATGIPTSTRQLAERLAKLMGIHPELRSAPPRLGDVRDSVLEPGRFPTSAMSLDDGLSLTIGNEMPELLEGRRVASLPS